MRGVIKSLKALDRTPVGNVEDLLIKVGNGKVTIFWSDPKDKNWKGTKLVYKIGSYPENAKDGIEILDSRERDNYKETGFEIDNLTNGIEYYFQLFPYSETLVITNNEVNRISATPVAYKIMTAIIDLTNSNPATCISYADDAIGMEAKSDAWDKFFGHYPCLFKEGKEVGKLNPNNFAQFEDGTEADITSGNAGNVMIAFPRRGVKISTSEDGNTLTVSITDNLDSEDFTYYAHTRGETRKEIFYLGAYKTSNMIAKLYSLSGKTPITNVSINNFRNYAHSTGIGYELIGFYQLTYIQIMYILKYKNLNSQIALGMGYVNASKIIQTGNTDTKGMDWRRNNWKSTNEIVWYGRCLG